MPMRFAHFLEVLGPLRAALIVIVIVETGFAPLALTEMEMTGWGVMRGAIVPATTVMTVFGLLLDILMSYVFTAEQSTAVRDKYAFIRRIEVWLFWILVCAWTPVFLYKLGYLPR